VIFYNRIILILYAMTYV